MSNFYSETGSDVPLRDMSSTSRSSKVSEYKFIQSEEIVFRDLTVEEEISKQDEVEFYKKAFKFMHIACL